MDGQEQKKTRELTVGIKPRRQVDFYEKGCAWRTGGDAVTFG